MTSKKTKAKAVKAPAHAGSSFDTYWQKRWHAVPWHMQKEIIESLRDEAIGRHLNLAEGEDDGIVDALYAAANFLEAEIG